MKKRRYTWPEPWDRTSVADDQRMLRGTLTKAGRKRQRDRMKRFVRLHR